MKIKNLFIAASIFMSIATASSVYGNENAVSERESYSVHPFTNLGTNIVDSFTGFNILLHGAAVGSTYLFTSTGVDWNTHTFFRDNDTYEGLFTPAAYIGYGLPAVLSGGFYLAGLLGDNNKALTAGSAMIQAIMISIVYNTLLKAFTGRPNPGSERYDNSRTFRFGFFRGGLHYGWPSGHMCTNTAMIVSLAYIYNDSWIVKIGGLLYLTYMFFGVIAHEGGTMHWFSDAVAGTLMGLAVGMAVGRNFKSVLNVENEDGTEVGLLPILAPQRQGIAISYSF